MSHTAILKKCAERTFFALGTWNDIKAYGVSDGKLLDPVVNRIREIDDRMSAFKPASDLSKISLSAGRGPVMLHEETLRLLRLAQRVSESSGGAFDVTIRPLTALWNIKRKSGVIPPDDTIRETLKLVGYRDLAIDEANQTACLKKPGQAVDLGGIAKGYAADEACHILKQGGVKSALINLGGNIAAVGTRPDGRPWEIGIQNPADVRGKYLGTLAVENLSVVTSGVNEQFFIKNGRRYHHILDPRTGRPAHSGLLSATVICGSSAYADTLSTAAFVLGVEQGTALLKKFGAEAVFATEDCKLYVTEGLVQSFRLSEDETVSSRRSI